MLTPNQLKITDYLNITFPCGCGREHSVPIKRILIEEDALLSISEIISSNGLKKSFILYDTTTYKVAGNMIERQMKLAALSYTNYVIKDTEPTPDEKTIGQVLINFDPTCDYIIAVGSGTINDLSRFISYKLSLPYMIIATAPSMDGFASNVAPLIVNHMKTTYEAQVPFAILGDTKFLKDAPMKMIAAGIGDILGKYTCLCDWNIAHTINGEYHCQVIEDLVRHSLETVVSNITMAKVRDPQAINSIMEALVLTGIAMSFAGNSRPASGSEHHLSHYWEMMFLFDGKQPILHGTKVGIGTVAVIKAYELLIERKIDFVEAGKVALNFSMENWEEQMRNAYQGASASVIALEKEIGKNSPENVLLRLKQLEMRWSVVKEIVAYLPSADHIRSLLLSLDAPSDPMSVGIDKTTFINSFMVAKELRNRFGLLQILFDLGLTNEIAEQVWDYFQN